MASDTNIYRITDIQKAYGCSYSEAVHARKLLFYISENIEELEEIIIKDEQELLLKFCLNFAKQDSISN